MQLCLGLKWYFEQEIKYGNVLVFSFEHNVEFNLFLIGKQYLLWYLASCLLWSHVAYHLAEIKHKIQHGNYENSTDKKWNKRQVNVTSGRSMCQRWKNHVSEWTTHMEYISSLAYSYISSRISSAVFKSKEFLQKTATQNKGIIPDSWNRQTCSVVD